MTQRPIDRVLERLQGQGVKQVGSTQWQCRCPHHEDSVSSLSVGCGDDGRVLLDCKAGCAVSDVVGALGLTMADLHADRSNTATSSGLGRIVATYDYHDASGSLLFQVVRFDPKNFRQRRPDGRGGWLWSLGDTKRVLYRLPELLAADSTAWVFVVEGEKDADNLRAIGLTATCNSGGACKWKLTDDSPLEGRQVAIIGDGDEPGRKHAIDAAGRLYGRAADVRIVTLPTELSGERVKDASDWLNAQDCRDPQDLAAELIRMADDAEPFTPTAEPAASEPLERSAIKPRYISASALINKCPRLREPIITGLLRRTEIGTLVSAPKMRKSFALLDLCVSAATGGSWLGFRIARPMSVLLFDCELHAETLARRLHDVLNWYRIDAASLGERFAIETIRGRGAFDVCDLGRYADAIGPGRFDLIVADPLYKLLPADCDENSNVQVAAVFGELQRVAEVMQAAVVACHHSSKGGQAAKVVSDVGAGAGSQSRAVDAHIVLREHSLHDHAVLDAIVRSWSPVDPVGLRWDYPVWQTADIDTSDLKQPGKKRSTQVDAVVVEPEPERETWTRQKFVAAYVGADPQVKSAIIARAADDGVASDRQIEKWIASAIGLGGVYVWKVPGDRRTWIASRPQPELNY